MRLFWIGVGALLALIAFAAGLLLSRPATPPAVTASALPSQVAIERLLATPLLDPNGQETKLSRWRGKPLIVNFWATWCPPCLTEMPVFSRLQEKYPSQVQFVGIAIDTPENVRDFVAKNRYSYPLLLASQDTMALMAELGNNRSGLPFTVSIDASGQVRHIRLGGLTEADTEHLIAGLQ